MDLLQMLILLTITGICGALAVWITGFSPRGVMVLLFSVICGTIGAAFGSFVGGLFKAWSGFPNLILIKIGTLRLDIGFTVLGSFAVLGVLALLQRILVRTDQRVSRVKQSDSTGR